MVFSFFTVKVASQINILQNEQLDFQFNVFSSVNINIDQILNDRNFFQHNMTQNEIKCSLTNQYFTIQEKTLNSIRNDDKSKIIIADEYLYYVELNNNNKVLTISTFDFNIIEDKDYLKNKQQFEFDSKGNYLVKLLIFQNILIISTNNDISFFNLALKSSVDFIYKINPGPIINSIFMNEKENIYVLTVKEIFIYDISKITQKIFSYAGRLMNLNSSDSIINLYDVNSLSFCKDIGFIAFKGFIYSFKEVLKDSGYVNSLSIHKIFKLDDNILRVIASGRSLVILTTLRLFEYKFEDSCESWSLMKNISLQEFGINNLNPKNWQNDIEIFIYNDSKYYLLHNKAGNKLYIIKKLDYGDHIFKYDYSPPFRIFDISHQEYFYNQNQTGLLIGILGSKFILKVLANKIPSQMSCKPTILSSLSLSINSSQYFCNNVMYNYSEFVKNLSSNQSFIEQYADETYFNPHSICQKHTNIVINFEIPKEKLAIIYSITTFLTLGFIFIFNYYLIKGYSSGMHHDFSDNYCEQENETETCKVQQYIQTTDRDILSSPKPFNKKLMEFNDVSFGNLKPPKFGDEQNLKFSTEVELGLKMNHHQ